MSNWFDRYFSLRWVIDFRAYQNEITNQELADLIMPEFWLKKSEYRVKGDCIEGTPSMMASFISPIRFSVYDIILKPDRNVHKIYIQVRLYKLYVITFLFSSVAATFSGSVLSFIIAWIASLLLFGIITWVQLKIVIAEINKKVNKASGEV